MRGRLGLALLLLAGCVDTDAKLEAFHQRDLAKRSRDAGAMEPRDGEVEEGRLPTPEEIEGEYLLVVATTLSPRKPIISLLEVKAAQKGDTLELTQRDRPLSFEDLRLPVGEFGPWRTSIVEADGSYMTDSIPIVTPGAANAVQPGVETESLLVFSGKVPLLSKDAPLTPLTFWCGQADGKLVRPIAQSLDGSTFTVMRIEDPDNYPLPVTNCAMDPAETL